MSRKYKFLNQQQAHFVSFATVNWIDLFVRPIYSDIVVDSLKYCINNKGLQLFAWCIMPSHVHLVIGTHENLQQDILRDLKSYTSRTLKEAILSNPKESRKEWIVWMMRRSGLKNSNNTDWQLWQQNNHPIELYSNSIINQKLNYLHYNPVVAGFVDAPEYWLYSSARNYCGQQGLIDVEVSV